VIYREVYSQFVYCLLQFTYVGRVKITLSRLVECWSLGNTWIDIESIHCAIWIVIDKE